MHKAAFLPILAVTILFGAAVADPQFDRLVRERKFQEAIDYAEVNLPIASRNASTMVDLARAYEEAGQVEKALATFMVCWRLNPTNYASLLGAAKIHNKLGQPDRAVTMAQKALEQNFTAEASWEFARACIALKRPGDAKKALEKVLESDARNLTANRELGLIYVAERNFGKAISLLRVAYQNKAEAALAYSLGKAYLETNSPDSAVLYLEEARRGGSDADGIQLDLARTYYKLNQFALAAEAFANIPGKSGLTSLDYYIRAVSIEKTKGTAQSIDYYRDAVAQFGSSVSKDALTARGKVGKWSLDQAQNSSAIAQFEFIYPVDARGEIVPGLPFMLAQAYAKSGNSSKAIEVLEKLIAQDKKNVQAYMALAELYENAKFPEKAKKTYEALRTLSPNDPGIYLSLGQYYLERSKYSDALENLLKSNSLRRSVEALTGIAQSSYQLKSYGTAKETGEAALVLDPNRWDLRKILAKIYMSEERFAEARNHLEELIKQSPNNYDFWLDLAICYEQLGKAELLAEADKKIIGLDSKNVDSRLRYGQHCLAQNNTRAALPIYKELAVLIPSNTEVLQTLVKICKDMGYTPDAITYLRRYVAIVPNQAGRYRELGDMLYERKNYDEALEAYRTAIKIDPKISGFYKRYAEIMIAKKQDEEVVKALLKLVGAGEADAQDYATLGMIYQKQGNYPRALATYQDALRVEPQNTEVLSAMGECYARAGNVRDAIITYEQVVIMNPNAIDEHKSLGELYDKVNRTDESARAYRAYLAKEPNDTKSARMLAQYAFGKGQYDEALKFFRLARLDEEAPFPELLAYGESAFRAGDFRECASVLERLGKRNPATANAIKIYRMLAESYEAVGEEAKAAEAYGAYNSQPGVRDGDASYKQASLVEKTDPSAALRIYEANTQKFPGDHRNFYRLYRLYSQEPKYLAKAVPMLKKAASLSDTVKINWFEVAKIHQKANQVDDELGALKKCLDADPQNVEANRRSGELLLQKGAIQDGLVYLEVAGTLSPSDWKIMLLLADGYEKTKRNNEAMELLSKARKLRKDDPEIAGRLVRVLAKTGQSKRALEEMRELVKTQRQPKMLLLYADLLLKEGKATEAENAVNDLRTMDPENVEAMMILGKAQAVQKRYDDALNTLKEVSLIDPQNALALFETGEVHLATGSILRAELFYKRSLERNSRFALGELGMAKIEKVRKNRSKYLSHLEAAKRLDPANELILNEIEKSKK